MPRPRAGGGVATYGGRIYYAGGLDPSRRESTPWFSVYDPATNRWSELPDMPRARDHFGAGIVDGKLYTIGGRHVVREHPVVENDAYDFATGKWITGFARLPSERSGTASAVLGDEILVLGGERVWSQPAKRTVDRTARPPTHGDRCPTWRSARTASRQRSATAGCTSPPVRPHRARRTPRRLPGVLPRSCDPLLDGDPAAPATPRLARWVGRCAPAPRPGSSAPCEAAEGAPCRLRRARGGRTSGLRAAAEHHYAYVVSQLKPTSLRVYDIDDGHRLVRTVPLPELEGDVAGMAADRGDRPSVRDLDRRRRMGVSSLL